MRWWQRLGDSLSCHRRLVLAVATASASWLSVRRLAFRAFMRSLRRLRSAFEKSFGFPLPAAPMMDAALILLPQWGHFTG